MPAANAWHNDTVPASSGLGFHMHVAKRKRFENHSHACCEAKTIRKPFTCMLRSENDSKTIHMHVAKR